MYFIQGLDSVEDVKAIRDNVKALLLQGTVTIEYTVQGNDFRKAQTVLPKDLPVLLQECNDFLIEHFLGVPLANATTPFIFR
jgi:hypothetical protein